MLTCTCPDYYPEDPGDWWYFEPDDFSKFQMKRRKRCCSCKGLIDIGSDCLEFRRERNPYTEIEEDILGCEIPMSSIFLCEKCGEIWLNLTALKYCVNPMDNMQECLEEYWKISGFKPKQ